MLTRRSFLSATAGALAIGPIKRHGAARMKLSLAAYSFREALTGRR